MGPSYNPKAFGFFFWPFSEFWPSQKQKKKGFLFFWFKFRTRFFDLILILKGNREVKADFFGPFFCIWPSFLQ